MQVSNLRVVKMSEPTLPAWAAYILLVPIFIFGLWHFNSALVPPPPPPAQLRGKRIVLLIAHPDDESMFFSPTVTKLTEPALENHLKILCLSSGNAEGLGDIRKNELESAALKLGLRGREDVLVIDDQTRFKDGMREHWDEKEIAKVLAQAFAPNAAVGENKPSNKKKGGSGPTATIDALITFDKDGVSSHPNHKALFHGAKLFLSNLMRDYSGYACPITMYTLTTVGVARKYSFVLDVMPTYFAGIMDDVRSAAQGKKPPKRVKGQGTGKGSRGDRVMFVSDLIKYWKGRSAMVYSHKSQMVWFRWGWISIGRYMVVNDLKKENV